MSMPTTILTKDQVLRYLPLRSEDSHKGTFGRVLAVCGSPEYRGAAMLSTLGALRTGAGLVTLAAPECVLQTVGSQICEAVFCPLDSAAPAPHIIETADVCLIGCGLPDSDSTAQLLEQIHTHAKGPVILDAGALCRIAKTPDLLARIAARVPVVVTPHPGEMAQLCNCETADVERERDSCAMDFSRNTGVITVLKGHRTLIACPDGILYENTTGNNGLARGGSGDVLAGMIAGLAAQGMPLADAAAAGVFLHGLAADLCARRLSRRGMLPHDILTDLGTIFLENEISV